MKLYATEIAASANRAVTIEYEIGHHRDKELLVHAYIMICILYTNI